MALARVRKDTGCMRLSTPSSPSSPLTWPSSLWKAATKHAWSDDISSGGAGWSADGDDVGGCDFIAGCCEYEVSGKPWKLRRSVPSPAA